MSEKKTKILLTGYRATGKTCTGRVVARRLGFDFLDTDREIERRVGKTISRMVADQGWSFFRLQEKNLLDELTERDQLVIAAGGGAVMHEHAWQRLRREALTFWLTASAATICSRLARDEKSKDQRPSLTEKDILEEVELVLNQRRTFYEEGSDLQVDSEQEVEGVADQITAAWNAIEAGDRNP